uniref:Uncharacterized protein n=1 Tax=viral metagenome TaxID=1070528 RepID=A0A6M3IGT9_9ZZZZ
MPWAIHNEDNYILPESQWLDEGLYAPSWAKSTKIGCKPNQYQRGWHVVVSKEECDLHYCRVIDVIRQVKFKQVVRYGYSYGLDQIPTIVCKQIYIIPQGEEVLG